MKTTGVVRRVDELGRIVIPKEIRKTLRLKDGESVEIFLDNNDIILKKHSPLEDLGNFYQNYVSSIQNVIGKNIFIVDRDKIVAVAGDLKKKYFEQKISSNIDQMIRASTTVIKNEEEIIYLTEELNEQAYFVLAPIIINGDAIGAVILLSIDKKIDEFEIKTITIAAKFLGKYIE